MVDTMETVAGSPPSGTEAPPVPAGQDRPQGITRALEDVKQIGNELLAAACDSVSALADEQRARAADEIAAVGSALHSAAASLDRHNDTLISGLADDAAQRVDDFAQTVRTRSWTQLADDLEDVARTWPAAYFAAAIGSGFLISRFLLATSPRQSGQSLRAQSAPEATSGGRGPAGGGLGANSAVSSAVLSAAGNGHDSSRETG